MKETGTENALIKQDQLEDYVPMCEEAKELQELIWKRKKIKRGSLFFIHARNELFLFPCDGYIYYEKEDKVWWVDGIRGKVVGSRNRLTNEMLLAMGGGQSVRLFDCDEAAFYKYDDGELNFVQVFQQHELQRMLSVRGFSWLVISFFQFCKSELKQHNWLTGEVNSSLNSWEKLWLAFIMKEKFNKRWNEEKWIKIEKD